MATSNTNREGFPADAPNGYSADHLARPARPSQTHDAQEAASGPEEEILSKARAQAEAILANARAQADQIRTQPEETSGRSNARLAAEQVIAKGAAAASEIRSSAATAREEIKTRAYAVADEIVARARMAAQEIRLKAPLLAEESLAWVQAVEEEILEKARAVLEEIEYSKGQQTGKAEMSERWRGEERSAPVRTHSRSPLSFARARMDRRNMLALAGGGIAAALLGEKLLHSRSGGTFGSSGILGGNAGGAPGANPTAAHVDISSMANATIPGATQVGLGILGDYIYLTPTKLGGGAHAQDLATGKTLAWIEYWNYGDSCPIAHHLSAYPSPDPRKGFEFVNSTQGGDNILIYGLPTDIKAHGLLNNVWGQGNRIYRVHYDGQQMNLVEDISETTGLGLGVHVVIFPDASGFACADGQKDVAGFFNRPPIPQLLKDDVAVGELNKGQKTQALMAFRGDWYGREPNGTLEANWANGGKLRITRLVKAKETGLYDYRGTKGNKIDWEMVPMGEYLVYSGQLPGDSPRTLCGLDAVVHHPGNRYSALIIRMCSAAVIVDRHTWEPVACLHNPEGSPGNLAVKKVTSSPDTWEIEFPDLKCVGHEAGFSPDGKFFTMMNNIRQNNMAVYDTSDADPRNWKKITFVKDDSWVGNYPSPFHICFSVDRSKMFVSVLYPKPAKSGTCVVDTATWKIIKKFENVGPDCQTMAVTYDGKYVLQIFSGFQRLESGVFVYTQDTLEPVGFMPNFGGHHDCVVVPTKVEQLVNSRCTTL